jgi:uncharacterized protein DUF5367
MKRIAIVGFAIWAGATIALRLAGQYVFRDGAAIPLLIVTLPLMIAVALLALRGQERRATAAIVLVAPGMLLDTISAIWFPVVFPNIRADAAGLFGGWLLFCNVVVLLTAIYPATRKYDSTAAPR